MADQAMADQAPTSTTRNQVLTRNMMNWYFTQALSNQASRKEPPSASFQPISMSKQLETNLPFPARQLQAKTL